MVHLSMGYKAAPDAKLEEMITTWTVGKQQLATRKENYMQMQKQMPSRWSVTERERLKSSAYFGT